MLDRLQTIFDGTIHAFDLIVHDAATVNPWLLAAGVALHLLHQAVRIRGWFNIIRAAYPKATALRHRDVIAAYFAGSGLNTVIPARGGDVMKLYMVKQRIPDGRYSTLVGTFFPETLFETTCGIALVGWALARGFLPVPTTRVEAPSIDVSLVIEHPFISTAIAAGLAIGIVLLVRALRRRAAAFVQRVKRGVAILKRPRDYFTGVVSWQALGRLIRLGSLACLMAAFGLPVSLDSVVLVMAAQGGGRIIPIAPASAGLRLAMLSYGLVEVSDQPVDIAQITAFSFGVSFVLFVVTLLIALAIIGRVFGTLNPRHAVAKARAALAERHAAEAPQPG